jgi:uncharacterized membrane protein
MYIVGLILAVATMGAWIYAESHKIDSAPLFVFVVPIVTALFIGHNLGATKEAAQQAANQTNGPLKDRMKSAVAEALAERDAARTRQAQGDISEDVYMNAPKGNTGAVLNG